MKVATYHGMSSISFHPHLMKENSMDVYSGKRGFSGEDPLKRIKI